MGRWGPGGPEAGNLAAAREAALAVLPTACSDADDARKAAAKVRCEALSGCADRRGSGRCAEEQNLLGGH